MDSLTWAVRERDELDFDVFFAFSFATSRLRELCFLAAQKNPPAQAGG
ncbi:MAG TPA: hypothetical protein VFE47_04490 [Tepidisphaeraceae bacterium]|jgi:hypothetical protein|nr:hypothetical protein [Tepidisphaeraceae bacterium]